ncbi:agglutinin-like [Carex rostrata]
MALGTFHPMAERPLPMASTPALTRNQVLIQKIGPVGGHGGTTFDMDTTGISRIVKISVRVSTVINSFGVSFVRDGREETAGMWGNTPGKLVEFELQPSEYITSIKGHIGDLVPTTVINSITFETNLGSFGPYGRNVGVPFELPAFGGQIIGFHGSAGDVLDRIGVYIQVPTQVLIQKIGPVGGHGGTRFDMDTNGISRIVKISVRVSTVINSFGVSFIRDGREESAGMWGSTPGKLVEFQLQPSEYITSVKGHIGDLVPTTVINSITFETNLGSFGPYGGNVGVPFELPAFGGQIIGFHGSAGDVLDRIGVYVKGF